MRIHSMNRIGLFKLLVVGMISFLNVSCAKKEVKIPTLAVPGIQELQNHSQVWMFFEVKDGDTIAELNQKNTISTTHWIYNIDKRLTLKLVVPELVSLQYKHANSVHSEKGTYNYLSYSDTISEKLSLYKMDEVLFVTDSMLSKEFIKKSPERYIDYNNINLTFNPNNNWINDTKLGLGELEEFLNDFIDFSGEGKQTMLHLNFNENLFYQDYMYYRTLVHGILKPNTSCNQLEFVFNPKKVPDCGCE